MEKEIVGEQLSAVGDLDAVQDVSPAGELGPDDLIDLSNEAPPPSNSGLREGDEELAGPSNPELAFNDDDVNNVPQALDDEEEDDVVDAVARKVTGFSATPPSKAMNPRLARFLRVAKREVGYRSPGGNPPRSKYGAWMGFPHSRGHYCAAFVSWCGAMSGNAKSVSKSGRVQFFLDRYKRKGRYGSKPRVGSLVIFDWEQNGKVDHIGIVVGVGNGYIDTIEGNTGSPNGVHLRRRRGPSIRGYCYPSFTGVSPPPPPARQVWHIVKKGETLSAISAHYGVSLAALLGRNKGHGPGQGKITNPNLIRVNQRIRVR